MTTTETETVTAEQIEAARAKVERLMGERSAATTTAAWRTAHEYLRAAQETLDGLEDQASAEALRQSRAQVLRREQANQELADDLATAEALAARQATELEQQREIIAEFSRRNVAANRQNHRLLRAQRRLADALIEELRRSEALMYDLRAMTQMRDLLRDQLAGLAAAIADELDMEGLMADSHPTTAFDNLLALEAAADVLGQRLIEVERVLDLVEGQ